jgi:threonine dehydrogenase-like Zn-dependent dehydrogenase
MVAIHSQPTPVHLFQFFWRELKMIGARLYEPEDFEKGIALAASGRLPLDRIVTDRIPLESLESGLRSMEQGGEVMKVLVRCS